jgi:hypothetical protein
MDNSMYLTCKVLDVFRTSIGTIAAIRPESDFPYLGMILRNSQNNEWRIKGMQMPREEFVDGKYQAFWDCVLEPINHEDPIKKGDVLLYKKEKLGNVSN